MNPSAQVGQVNPSFIQTITVGLGISPSHTHLRIPEEFEGSARGLYHRSGITPCPEGYYSVVSILPLLTRRPRSGDETYFLAGLTKDIQHTVELFIGMASHVTGAQKLPPFGDGR